MDLASSCTTVAFAGQELAPAPQGESRAVSYACGRLLWRHRAWPLGHSG